jgi:hypothetical protein
MSVIDLKLRIFSLASYYKLRWRSASEYSSVRRSVITNYELRITNYLKMSPAGIALL